MGTRVRSSTGCWTCRLRRKKCDEQKPTCARCQKLQLHCDGYNERPPWMDGGEKEKIRSEQTKKILREKLEHKSSLSRHNSSDKPPRQRNSSQAASNTSRSEIPPASDLPFSGYHVEELPVSFEAHSDPFTDAWAESFMSDAEAFSMSTMDLVGPPLPTEESPDTWLSSCSSASSSNTSICSSSQLRMYCGRAGWEHQPVLEEADLLLHYFDHIQGIQYPFMTKSDRGWIYVLVARTKLSYWSTISLSAYKKGLALSNYYNLAILELRRYLCAIEVNPATRSDMIADCCFSMVQLMFLEILKGELDTCKMHMNAAYALLSKFSGSDTELALSSHPRKISKPNPEGDNNLNTSVLQFAGVVLQWFDVVSCCSLRLDIFFLDRTSETHEDAVLDLSDLAGCQRWVGVSLSKILTLDSWKRKALKEGSLSVLELVKRGTEIEAQLQRGLSACSETSGPENTDLPHARSRDQRSRHITMIFAGAALVFLHVVVAGAHREVPEICRGTQKSISRFRNLPNQEILRSLAWPFCVTGCLARVEDRKFLTDLAEKVITEEHNASNIEKALEVMKECWRLRDQSELADADWSTAISSLGHQTILL